MVSFGKKFSGLERVEDFTGQPIEWTIPRMAQCEYSLGIMSGPLHIVAALGLRCIAVINFPSALEICLPPKGQSSEIGVVLPAKCCPPPGRRE
jgi:hypothetical protein